MAERICSLIADGLSLRKVCEADDMPDKETVRRWLIADEAFRAQYARARDEQADFYADELVEIADTEDDPAKARVRVDARKWVASKLKPKKYGERIEHGGEIVHRHSLADILRAIPDCEDPPVEAGGAS